jgi:hypothetical protein
MPSNDPYGERCQGALTRRIHRHPLRLRDHCRPACAGKAQPAGVGLIEQMVHCRQKADGDQHRFCAQGTGDFDYARKRGSLAAVFEPGNLGLCCAGEGRDLGLRQAHLAAAVAESTAQRFRDVFARCYPGFCMMERKYTSNDTVEQSFLPPPPIMTIIPRDGVRPLAVFPLDR